MNLISIPGAPAWFDALLNLSAQATILAGLVWIVLKLVGRWIPPSWRAWMWFLVIARVLIPFAPSSQLSLQNLFAPSPAPVTAPQVRFTAAPKFNLTVALPTEDASFPLIETPETLETLPATPPVRVNWGFVSATVWISSAVFFLAVLGARSLVIRYRLVQHGFAPAAFILELLAACRAQLRLRYPVRATASDRIAAPALTGLIPARLIVPTTFGTDRFTVAQIRQILLHELAHVQQGHLLLHWLALIARAAHWFNPAIHFAANRLRQECELAADAAALKNSTEQERADYGETILRVLTFSTAPRTLLALGIAAQARHLKQRLRALRSPTQHATGVGFICTLLLAATGLTGATNPKNDQSKANEKTNLSPSEMINQFATHDFIRLTTNGEVQTVSDREIDEQLLRNKNLTSFNRNGLASTNDGPSHGANATTNVTRLTTVQLARRMLLSGDIQGAESELQKGVENGTLDSIAVETTSILRPLTIVSTNEPATSAGSVIPEPNSALAIKTIPGIIGVSPPLAPPATTNKVVDLSDFPFVRRLLRSDRQTNVIEIPAPSGRLDTLRDEQLRNSSGIQDAQTLMNLGRYGEAKTLLRRELQDNPNNPAAQNLLNEINGHPGQKTKNNYGPTQFDDSFVRTNGTQTVRNHASTTSSLIEDARFLIEMGRLDRAEEKLKEAIKIDPDQRVASYYLDLIEQQRTAQEARKRDGASNDELAEIQKLWSERLSRDLLPQPNPLAMANPVNTSPGRQAIYRKLETIRIDEFPLSSETELIEVLKELGSEIRKRDPGGRVNLIVTVSDGLDAGAFKIKFNPPIRDVTLKQFLDAIVMVAQPPQPGPNVGLAYSVEDYAVVFRPRRIDQEPMVSRTFKVDPNTFRQGLDGVFSFNPFQGLTGSGQQANGGGGFFTFEGGKMAANSGANGISHVTTQTNVGSIQQRVRDFFVVAGVEFPTNNVAVGGAVPANFGIGGPDHVQQKALFFNDRAGVLYVRAPLRELDIVENAVHTLNTTLAPSEVRFDVRVYETSAAGFPEEVRAAIAEPQLPLLRTLAVATNVGWLTLPQLTVFLKAADNSTSMRAIKNMSMLAKIGRQVRIPLDKQDLEAAGDRGSALDVVLTGNGQVRDALDLSCVVTTSENITTPTDTTPTFRVRQFELPKTKLEISQTLIIAAPAPSPRVPVLGDIPGVDRLFTKPETDPQQRIRLILITPMAVGLGK